MVADPRRSERRAGPRRLALRARFVLAEAFASLRAASGSRAAAQVAFYVVMAFPAALMLIVWGLSTALDDPDVRTDVVDAIVRELPFSPESAGEIEKVLGEVAAGAGSLGWIGAVGLLYTASGAMSALRHAVNEAWGAPDRRPYLRAKALDVALVLVVAPALVAALGLGLLRPLTDLLGEAPLVSGSLEWLVRNVVPAVLAFGALLVVFWRLPAAHPPLRHVLPGVVVALVGLRLVDYALRIYFSEFDDSSAVYGTIGALLAFGLAVHVQATAIVFAAHAVATLDRFGDWAAIDRAIAERPSGPPLRRRAVAAVRGLFVRA